jgi:hypothetical protein
MVGCEKQVEELVLPDCQRAFLRVPIAAVEGAIALDYEARASGMAAVEQLDPETPIGRLEAHELSPAILRLTFVDTEVLILFEGFRLALTSTTVHAMIDASSGRHPRASIELRDASNELLLASWLGEQPPDLDELELRYQDGRYCRLETCGYVDRDLRVRANGDELLLDPSTTGSIAGFRVANAQSQRHGDEAPQGCTSRHPEYVSGYVARSPSNL